MVAKKALELAAEENGLNLDDLEYELFKETFDRAFEIFKDSLKPNYKKTRAAAIEYSKDKIKGTSADDETNRGYAVKDFIEGAIWTYNNKN